MFWNERVDAASRFVITNAEELTSVTVPASLSRFRRFANYTEVAEHRACRSTKKVQDRERPGERTRRFRVRRLRGKGREGQGRKVEGVDTQDYPCCRNEKSAAKRKVHERERFRKEHGSKQKRCSS